MRLHGHGAQARLVWRRLDRPHEFYCDRISHRSFIIQRTSFFIAHALRDCFCEFSRFINRPMCESSFKLQAKFPIRARRLSKCAPQKHTHTQISCDFETAVPPAAPTEAARGPGPYPTGRGTTTRAGAWRARPVCVCQHKNARGPSKPYPTGRGTTTRVGEQISNASSQPPPLIRPTAVGRTHGFRSRTAGK